MYKPNYPCDLHTHTTNSDGNDTYIELIDTASKMGMKVIAITDHDVRPIKEINTEGTLVASVEYAKQRGLILIPGIEFSCETHIDDVHIVGLNCNFDNPLFSEVELLMEQSKINGYKKLVEILYADGIKITWNELLEDKNGLKKDSDVQRKHIFELIANKGYTDNWQSAKLMIKNNPIYNIRRDKIDPIEAVNIIHKTGGIAILAHPYLINSVVEKDNIKLDRREYIDYLIKYSKLDGIEASYNYSKTSYEGHLTDEEVEHEIKDLYENKLSIISGGSDYHNDGKKGTKNPRMIGEKGIEYDYFINNKLLCKLI